MHRTLHLLVLFLLAAAPAAAQRPIAVGETVTGELAAGDLATPDGNHYDAWRFSAQEGVTYVITLRSEDFDAFLRAGLRDGTNCEPCDWDDEGAGGTDARLVVRAEVGTSYVIHAGTYAPGETGRYTLHLEKAETTVGYDADTTVAVGPGADSVVSAEPGPDIENMPRALAMDETGRLEEGDTRQENGALMDVFTYQGIAGDTITIQMESEDFDTVVRVLIQRDDGGWEEIGFDDDGGSGTDSELTMLLAWDDTYFIHAAALNPGEGGAYRFRIYRRN
ncbi:MAG TPA: hypothetical protein VGC13_26760 [Longimicrobium sp.]|jgi:hypothetical protein|uniref:hypothetical protein n=1 Tax=Longimicrobium sp. TaxID=2029185 RepID=UPI002ED97CF8